MPLCEYSMDLSWNTFWISFNDNVGRAKWGTRATILGQNMYLQGLVCYNLVCYNHIPREFSSKSQCKVSHGHSACFDPGKVQKPNQTKPELPMCSFITYVLRVHRKNAWHYSRIDHFISPQDKKTTIFEDFWGPKSQHGCRHIITGSKPNSPT